MKGAAIMGLLALTLLAGFGACSRGGLRNDDVDTQLEVEVPEAGEIEIMEDERDDMAEAVDALDLMDSVDASQELDLPEGLVGYQELRSFIPSKPPTHCGEGCRQVSFADDDIWSSSVEVWGNYMVFNTMRSVPDGGARKNVYLVDLTTLEHYILKEASTTDPVYYATAYVSIYENLVLYDLKLQNTFDYHLMSYDLNTHYQDVLWVVAARSSALRFVQLYDHYASWWDNRSGETGDGRVYLLDLMSRTEKEISTQPCFVCGDVEMYGRWVVFISDNGGNDWPHVFVHDIETGTTRKITTGNWAHMWPAVWGDIVVWTDMRQGGDYVDYGMADIYMHNLTTEQESVVCNNPASQVVGTIYEDKIVWTDFRNDPEYANVPSMATISDIYLYSLSTGEVRLLTNSDARKGAFRIRGNKIYFFMKDNADVLSVFELTY